MEEPQQNAWLERGTGEKVLIRGSCFIGRSTTSSLVLPSEKVSRRHAMIQTQGSEFWLVDLGSANGTYLNGRRVGQPCRLNDRDRVMIGDFQFVFRSNATVQQEARMETTVDGKTIQDIKTAMCWLLVADIISSTQLSKRLSPEEAPRITGRWLSECKQIVEDSGGIINKFLGDGFFAYWPDEQSSKAPNVARTLESFRKLQQNSEPPFRVVAHYGKVFMGGGGSMGEESLMGNEVNFIFRMEKVSGGLGQPFLVSEAAARHLETLVRLTEAGSHPVASFEGTYKMFSL